ncbi:hypothetical protein pipiens_002316 [Culex pipiens pipiens]|uniref:Uncharacterized protein n=1 Tax=Culex pipiens pipiens TaxID=38569 RepID=A0ABD1DGR3_CULPP
MQAFPHVLSFQGIIIRQIFDRLHPEQSNARSIEQLLRAGILLDERSFSSFDDKLVRGALRILKQMPNRGISLKGQVGADPDVVFAQPLIQWIHTDATKSNNEWLDNHAENRINQMPHIVCLAPTKQSGQFYVVFNSYSLSVGNHFPIAVEILFKMIIALNLKTPAPLKKMYDLIALQIFKTIDSSESVAVTKLNKRLNELYEGAVLILLGLQEPPRYRWPGRSRHLWSGTTTVQPMLIVKAKPRNNEVETEAPEADESTPDPFGNIEPSPLSDPNRFREGSIWTSRLYVFPRKILNIYRNC